MKRRSPWKRQEVLLYIIDCYEGVELLPGPRGVIRPVRSFLWADPEGAVWIGNSAAFAEHLAERFGYPHSKYDYVSINSHLIYMGERIHEESSRRPGTTSAQPPLQPRKELAK